MFLVRRRTLGAADSTDSAVYQLIGTTLGGVLFAPPAALTVTSHGGRRARFV